MAILPSIMLNPLEIIHSINLYYPLLSDCMAITHVSPTNILGLESFSKKIDHCKEHKIFFSLSNINSANVDSGRSEVLSATSSTEENSSVIDFSAKAKQIVSLFKANGCTMSPHLSASAKPTPFNLYNNVSCISIKTFDFLISTNSLQEKNKIKMIYIVHNK